MVLYLLLKKHYSTDDLEMKPHFITNMMQRKDISKYIYKYLIEKEEKENFVKGIVKWEQQLDTELDGSMLFNDIYRITNDTKLRNFLFKPLHHILLNNKLLHKMGMKNSALCNFCNQEEDSILHYLRGCPVARRIWTSFNIWLSSALDLEVFELTSKETVLGLFSDESSLQKIVPFVFLVLRSYIHCCKWTDTNPVLNIFKIKVKQKEKIEKINALVENKMYKHDNKWCYLHELNL
jgi:hypothetical protein